MIWRKKLLTLGASGAAVAAVLGLAGVGWLMRLILDGSLCCTTLVVNGIHGGMTP